MQKVLIILSQRNLRFSKCFFHSCPDATQETNTEPQHDQYRKLLFLSAVTIFNKNCLLQ